MDITVALDGSRQRDIELVAGDQLTLNVTVYLHDADPAPVAVTELSLAVYGYPGFAVPIGTAFTVPDGYPGRWRYLIAGKIGGNRTALCYGVLELFGDNTAFFSGTDYGMGWAWAAGGYPWR